jgi:hypothetical protein
MVMTPRRHKWGKSATARANFGFLVGYQLLLRLESNLSNC